jgi:hypothetical protein
MPACPQVLFFRANDNATALKLSTEATHEMMREGSDVAALHMVRANPSAAAGLSHGRRHIAGSRCVLGHTLWSAACM